MCHHYVNCRGLWIIGGFTILSALFGLLGSVRLSCCMTFHASLSLIAVLAQLGLLIYFFVDPSGAVSKLEDYATSRGKEPK